MPELSNIEESIGEDKSNSFAFSKIVWSAFYFALSYILLSYLSYAVQAFNAGLLDYHVIFSYNSVNITGGTSPWTLKRVAFIFLASPLIGLLFSFIGFVGNRYTSRENSSHLKLFFYWLCINGFALFYSYFFTGLMMLGDYYSKYFTGFAIFFTWFYLEKSTVTLILLFFAMLFSLVPVFMGRMTLNNSYSANLLRNKNGRTIVFINTLVLPYLIGTALVLAATYPMDINYTIVRLLCYPIIFAVIFAWLQTQMHLAYTIKKGGISGRSAYLLLVLSALLIITGKFVLPIQLFFNK